VGSSGDAIISAVKRVEFISDGMSYVILRGRWCDIIILNVHAPTEDKIDDMRDRFYEELEHVFDKFPKYHMKILLRDFNAKVGKSPNVHLVQNSSSHLLLVSS
jgi:hydroxypyruvate isomerase